MNAKLPDPEKFRLFSDLVACSAKHATVYPTVTFPPSEYAQEVHQLKKLTINLSVDALAGRRHKKTQKQKAAKPRNGNSAKIIRQLATAAGFLDFSAKELWLEFFGKLDAAELEPSDEDGTYEWNEGDEVRRARMGFRTFANRLSEHRAANKKITIAGLP